MFAQSTKPVWYEPHPVTVERKAELRAKGFVILDAVFMPADHLQSEDAIGATLPPVNGEVQVHPAKVTADELRAALTAKGIPFKVSASKSELQALLTQEA